MEVSWGAVSARLVLLGGYTLVTGCAVFEGLVARQELPHGEGRRLAIAPLISAGVAAMAIATLIEFVSLVLDLAGGDRSEAMTLVLPLLTNLKGTGGVWLLRLLLLVAVWFWRVALKRKFGPPAPFVISLALGAALAGDGHGADFGFLSLLLLTDTLHAAAGGSWLGGLGLLWLNVGRLETPTQAVEAFSKLATITFPVAIAAGTVDAGFHLWGRAAPAVLLTTPYVLALGFKVMVVCIVTGMALLMRQRHMAELSKGGPVAAFRRHLAWELAFGLAILIATAWLTQSPTPGSGLP